MTTTITNPPSHTALLEPRYLASISRMELVAKQVMDGYVQGMHRSPHIGFALDFAQHRQYAPGDDIKRIDWRVYAKADRFYIKQYEVTTNLRAFFVLDASGSMAYQGANDAMSKFRYGQFVVACLAYLVLRQTDSAGLITFGRIVRDFLPARSASSHLLTITKTLDAARPEGEGPISTVLHDVAERLKNRGLVVVISDFFDKADDLIEALHHLRHKRHEVILLQIMADDELTFPFRKFSMFESLETDAERIKLDPSAMRATYLQNLATHLKALRDGANGLKISHALLKTSDSVEKALVEYLAVRAGRR